MSEPCLLMRMGFTLKRGASDSFKTSLTERPLSLLLGLMIQFLLLQNRQGKTRLSKYYRNYQDDEKVKIESEVHRIVTSRDAKFTNFVEVNTQTPHTYTPNTHTHTLSPHHPKYTNAVQTI